MKNFLKNLFEPKAPKPEPIPSVERHYHFPDWAVEKMALQWDISYGPSVPQGEKYQKVKFWKVMFDSIAHEVDYEKLPRGTRWNLNWDSLMSPKLTIIYPPGYDPDSKTKK